MGIIIGLIISFIPAILLFLYLRNLHKEDPEYRADCRRLLIKGALCSVGVVVLALTFSIVWHITGLDQSHPLIRELFRTFILAAFIEEFVKYQATNKVIKKNRGSFSRLDCIAYSAIVGIGFQMIETAAYLLESNVIQILVRGFTLGHPAYGMLMGYFTGKAYYTGKDHYKMTAFALPFLLHGLYDFSLSDELQALNDNLVFLPFILVLIELIILIRMLFLIRKERKGTEYTKPLLG